MPDLNRTVLKIASEQGMGIVSLGMIIMKALKNSGFEVYGEREFNSLIKGGRTNIQINFGNQPIRSLSQTIDIGLGIDREGVLDCLETLKEGGILIHGFDRWQKAIKNLPKLADQKNLTVIQVPAREIALENGGNVLMTNVVLLGFLWRVLGLDLTSLKEQITDKFGSKKEFLPINLRCGEAGYNYSEADLNEIQNKFQLNTVTEEEIQERSQKMLIDGNSAIGLGAIQAGVRAYYAYPMSPSSSLLSYLAKIAPQTGMLVKQLEDEISVVQTTIGSMHVGARALCATSGGGFDLMTETVSLSAMIETPLVVVLGQRPGPATGLPTWTAQGDLELAVYASHGEFTRCVIAISDPQSAYIQIQKAFNLAEKYQIPVIVLTEANIAMSYHTETPFEENIVPIERHLTVASQDLDNQSELPTFIPPETRTQQNWEEVDKLRSSDRYKLTESGISPRWLPGSSHTVYFANGDEHGADGTLTEEEELSGQMINKRIRKTDFLQAELPEPEEFVFNSEATQTITLVGWGSSQNVALDTFQELAQAYPQIKLVYLHYTYIWPLQTNTLKQYQTNSQKLLILEGNQTGQLARLIHSEAEIEFDNKLLKGNGRPFYVEEVWNFLEQNLNS
jgi:2-oxoglutarate ferredoxin oxidoreductase subunit alpha